MDHNEYAIRKQKGDPLLLARRTGTYTWHIYGNPPETFHGMPYETQKLDIEIEGAP